MYTLFIPCKKRFYIIYNVFFIQDIRFLILNFFRKLDALQKNPKNTDIVLENIPQNGNLVNSNPSDEGTADEERSGSKYRYSNKLYIKINQMLSVI